MPLTNTNTIQYKIHLLPLVTFWYQQTYKQHFIIAVAQFNRNKPNYVYLNIISTGLYTTFIGGEILCRLI